MTASLKLDESRLQCTDEALVSPVCTETCMDMGRGTCTDMRADMCIHMCIEMRAVMCTEMCVDVWVDVYADRHACA